MNFKFPSEIWCCIAPVIFGRILRRLRWLGRFKFSILTGKSSVHLYFTAKKITNMENASLVELKPDRNLLDPNFTGYKLSLDPIPMYIASLSSKVDHVLRSEEQYSLQHVKLFGLHNDLFYDPWNLDDVYFIDQKWMVQRNVVNQETGKLTGVSKVWEIPSNHERRAGHYSPSACFPAEDLVLLSDGAGTLHLVKSGDRKKSASSDKNESQWKGLLTDEVCGAEVPFVVVHARVLEAEKDASEEAAGGRKVHCLLLHVEEAKTVKGQKTLPQNEDSGSGKTRHTAFVSELEWVTLHEGKDGSWSVGRIRQLCGSAIPDYATVGKDGVSLIIGSEQPFTFITDTEKPLLKEAKSDEEKVVEPEDTTGIVWQQNLEEITLTIPLEKTEKEATVDGVVVNVVDGNKVSVSHNEKKLFEGVTLHLLDHDLTTWEVKDGILSVCFHKKEKGQIWNKILTEGEPKGVEKVDPSLAADIHSRLSHLTSEFQDPAAGATPVFNSEELEDCDEVSTTDASLSRLDGELHATTHKASISSNQWLFNVQMDPDSSPAVCLRHGLDGLLWQPQYPKPSDPSTKEESKDVTNGWSCSHVASFITFGYVQASKERKKFITCAPDTSYAAVCEASQYIYIYRQPKELADGAELRNRRTGEKISHVAQQQLITLPSSQEVLGIHASSTTLYVLMEDKLLAYVLNQ